MLLKPALYLQRYLEENPYYERRYNLEKAAGLSALKAADPDHPEEEDDAMPEDKVLIYWVPRD